MEQEDTRIDSKTDMTSDIYEEIIEEESFTKVKIEPSLLSDLLSGGSTFPEEFIDFDDLKDTIAKVDPSLLEDISFKSEMCGKDFATKNKFHNSSVETQDELDTTIELSDDESEENTELFVDEELVREYEDLVQEDEELVQESERVGRSKSNENVMNKCKTCAKTFTRSAALKSHELLHSLDEDSLSEEVDCGISNSGDELYSDSCDEHVDRKKRLKQRTGKISKIIDMINFQKERNESSSRIISLYNSDVQKDVEFPKCTSKFVTDNLVNSESDSISTEKSARRKCSRNKSSGRRIKKQLSPVKCNMCEKTFTSKYYLNTHVKNIHENMVERCKCNECGKYIIGKQHLKRHINGVHLKIGPKRTNGSKKYTCDICGFVRYGKSEMREHMNMHTGERPHKCDQCGKCYSNRSSLFCHVRNVHKSQMGENPYACNMCDKSFRLKITLYFHVRKKHNLKNNIRSKNTTEKVHQCDQCGKCYLNRGTLLQHIYKKHQSENNIVMNRTCHICGKVLSNSTVLRDHMNLHTGEKPYACDRCGVRYPNKISLHCHVKSTHNGYKRKQQFKCKFCTKVFKNKRCLAEHSLDCTEKVVSN